MTPVIRTRTGRRVAPVGVLVVALALASIVVGCGGDDDDILGGPSTGSTGEAHDAEQTTTSADEPEVDRRPDPVAYCAAEAALETEPPPASSESDDVAAWAEETARPLVDDVLATAPDEVFGDIEVVSGTLDELIADGDTAVLDEPGYVAAVDRAHQYDLATCGWARVDVTADEGPARPGPNGEPQPDLHGFFGIPPVLPAGITSFEFSNVGVEHHEIRLYREAVPGAFDAEGSSEAFLEVYESPDRPTPDIAVKVGTGEYAAPGDRGYFVADMTPGHYAAVCFVPVGSVSEDQPPPPGAAPHFLRGQTTIFDVI